MRGLLDGVVSAVQQCLQPRLSGRQRAFGRLDVLGSTAAAHVLQSGLLLRQRGLRGGDVLGARAGLKTCQTRLCLRQRGAGLEDLHLWVVLIEHGQRVAGLDLAADVDQQLLDTTRGFGEDADLLSGADLAAVRQRLLNIAAMGGLGGYRHGWSRNGPRPRRSGGRSLAARRKERGADQSAAERNALASPACK